MKTIQITLEVPESADRIPVTAWSTVDRQRLKFEAWGEPCRVVKSVLAEMSDMIHKVLFPTPVTVSSSSLSAPRAVGKKTIQTSVETPLSTCPRYRAVVRIRGMVTQKLYGFDQVKLLARAIKALTFYKPGQASLTPLSVSIFKEMEEIYKDRTSGPSVRKVWVEVTHVPYDSIPEDQLEWRKKVSTPAPRSGKSKGR